MIRIAIDRGGTFTDIFAISDDGRVVSEKILSQSPRYDDPNAYGVELVLRRLGATMDEVEWIRLGTTVATNALLERKGADVSLLVTKGFKDLLEIGYQDRPDLFALEIEKPRPLYKEVLEVEERLDAQGQVVRPLGAIPRPRCKDVAVVSLHAYREPAHERAIKAALPDHRVTLSSDVMPLPKAIDRAASTVAEAYLAPVVRRYVERLSRHLPKEKLYFIKSDGGLAEADRFGGLDALLSGPAGGVVALRGVFAGEPLIGFDMGGTSTDMSRYDGELELCYENEVAGQRITRAMVEIHTVAAGGGSRLVYKNGMFLVGPESTGSDPGPVCYGRGGELSVTDANLVTGRLSPDLMPHIFGKDGKSPLDLAAARAAFEPIAREVGRSVEEVAQAFLDVADEEMAAAIKEITVKKGYDPKEHTLCVFGGAGGQHAVGVARRLGIERVVVPRFGGIFSAVGIAQAEPAGELVAAAPDDLEAGFCALEERVPAGFEARRSLFVRVEGTNTAIEVPFEDYREEFLRRFARRFGYVPEGELVIEGIKVSYHQSQPPLSIPPLDATPGRPIARRRLFLDGEWVEADLYDRVWAGMEIVGPALVATGHTTLVLDGKSSLRVDERGDIHLRVEPAQRKSDIEAARLTLLSNRLGFIAKKMGEILQKSAKSVNIKERADFSCAIFDPEGNLIVNAPHIPVHLGSMSSVVKHLVARGYRDATYITNAPYEGGSHLPDITLVTPYIREGRTLFWVASRGHHADIGGAVPGSMPPFSKWLGEEGAVIEAFAVMEDGRFYEERLREIFERAGARNVDENISDILAQLAANKSGIEALSQMDMDELAWFFGRIRQVSRRRMEEFLSRCEPCSGEDYLDNGAKIAFSFYKEAGRFVFDFGGSSPQLLGNQNAPLAVVRSAVLYSLRAMLGEDVPLNEGLLEAIELRVPQASLLCPDPALAVVGGNVTTSQRVVDVILRAFGAAANAQGCMNNIIFGNDAFGYYETICGGAGATPKAPGASAVHTHMTNTRITDVEIIESRYPVRIEEFGIRRGSGGGGRHRGGDGAVRTYRFLEEVEVSLLTERRSFAPRGLAGGEPGARGRNTLIRDGKTFDLGGKSTFKAQKGDLLVIETPGGGGWGSRK
jgi:5-oxoprolinase (ATP-hydrolysing)